VIYRAQRESRDRLPLGFSGSQIRGEGADREAMGGAGEEDYDGGGADGDILL
jgi:hypothetical protein